jgi:hypothetical protein
MALSTSNITSGFIDLATFDEIEKYMYGGADATAYFVRETRKSTWFTQVPVTLSRASGQPGFGQEWSVSISRAGDYLLQTWLRLVLSSVTPASGFTVKWTKNFMHNLVQECSITFNDLVAARFDSYFLDFWSAFTVPAGKQDGYNRMIGNKIIIDQENTLNLPLPFFYTRDSGVALPTAALPYNEMRINFTFRNWEDLLISYSANGVIVSSTAVANLSGSTAPTMSNVNVWANYAIVSNDERKRMACAPRDILIEQVQTAPRQPFTPTVNQTPSYDIRFSHAIKALFLGIRNTTYKSVHSNYATESPEYTDSLYPGVDLDDPISKISLIYENTNRLGQISSDYYSLVNPYYNAPTIPTQNPMLPDDGKSYITSYIGYHMYSYTLDLISLDPMGSTNFGKLTNVSVILEASSAAETAAAGSMSLSEGQKFESVIVAVNNNIIRISGGALGFPVL